jgi:hypothetical protein
MYSDSAKSKRRRKRVQMYTDSYSRILAGCSVQYILSPPFGVGGVKSVL